MTVPSLDQLDSMLVAVEKINWKPIILIPHLRKYDSLALKARKEFRGRATVERSHWIPPDKVIVLTSPPPKVRRKWLT